LKFNFRNLLAALAYLHESTPAITHNDIKIENIFQMPGNDLNLILGDFGLARVHDSSNDVFE